MFELIELSAEIAKYNEILLHCINVNDTCNFDLKKSEILKAKITELQIKFEKLKNKWF